MMVSLHESELPKRDYQEIHKTLVACGFDPDIKVSIWELNEDGWRHTGKTYLVTAICTYEWNQANIGRRFSSSSYKVTAKYIFPPEADFDRGGEEGLPVILKS